MNLVLILLAGIGAQLVDGSLGMGYGITSASLLLATGLAPALVSTSVNVAQLGTTFTSGVSHWRAGNVDGRAMARLAIPGGIGGLAGATVLSSLAMGHARPVMAVLLLVLGIIVLVRFLARGHRRTAHEAVLMRGRFLIPLGLLGGFVNATGGGGWGPIVTSTLLTSTATSPRRVIGTVSASEFVVTVCACVGFLAGLGLSGIPGWTVLALMAGGVVAAPIAARLAGRLPAAILGVAVGALIVTLNLGEALSALGVPDAAVGTARIVAAAVCLLLLAIAVLRTRTAQRRFALEDRAHGPTASSRLAPTIGG